MSKFWVKDKEDFQSWSSRHFKTNAGVTIPGQNIFPVLIVISSIKMSQPQTYSDLCWTVCASSLHTENAAVLPNPSLANLNKWDFEKNATIPATEHTALFDTRQDNFMQNYQEESSDNPKQIRFAPKLYMWLRELLNSFDCDL